MKSMTKRGEIVIVPLQWRAPVMSAVFSSVLGLGLINSGTAFATHPQENLCYSTHHGSYRIIPANRSISWFLHHLHGDDDVITFYEDNDGDGFGTTASTVEDCEEPEGYAAVIGDCDDADAAANPDATEITGNGKDDDCDPATPDAVGTVCPCGNAEDLFADFENAAVPPVVVAECAAEGGITVIGVEDNAQPFHAWLRMVASGSVRTCQYIWADVIGEFIFIRQDDSLTPDEIQACSDDISVVTQGLGGCLTVAFGDC